MPIVFLTMVGIAFSSCSSDKLEIAPCASEIPATVSFQKNILPLFHATCSLSGCHTGAFPQAHLNLDDSVAYSQLWKPGKGYVDTINPNFSVLYTRLTDVNRPMPPAGRLDACKIQLILKWIQQGGLNN